MGFSVTCALVKRDDILSLHNSGPNYARTLLANTFELYLSLFPFL